MPSTLLAVVSAAPAGSGGISVEHFLLLLAVVLIAAKVLGIILLAFLSILLLSNIITALSTFFLAKDLDLLVAAPSGLRKVPDRMVALPGALFLAGVFNLVDEISEQPGIPVLPKQSAIGG